MQEKVKSLLKKFELKRGKIDLTLDRMEKFLASLGNPHLKTAPVIHIAGTNGKGSTLAFLRAMIEAAGKTCHVYTSPHLINFNERIVIHGNNISDDFLYDVLNKVDAAAAGSDITFFEITTAAAFLAFAETQADYVLLETGLGGRLDATNVVPKPLLNIITPISLDHMEFLGESLAEIAGEKAAIMKPYVTCISAPQVDEVKQVLEAYALDVNATLKFAAYEKNLPELSLTGEHQKVNASVAIEAARKLNLPPDAIRAGLQNARWHGRLQKMVKGPLAGMVTKGSELWLDGAHNQGGAAILAEFLRNKKGPIYLIIGMMQRKDPKKFLTHFEGLIKRIYTIPINTSEPVFDNTELASAARDLGFDAIAVKSADDALMDIALKEPRQSTVLIAGSLYLAGDILQKNS